MPHLGTPLRDAVDGICLAKFEQTVAGRGLFDPDDVSRLVRENTSNRADHAYLIYALLNLEIWQRTFVDRPGCEVVWDEEFIRAS